MPEQGLARLKAQKYNIFCPHRKPNPYKNIAKATQEHSAVSNTLNRNFKQEIPRKVLLTDITYLTYGNSKRAYLSTIKDSCTNEILSYEVSSSLSLEIALNTVKRLTRKRFQLHSDCLMHSDQGVHYTSPKFQKLLKEKGIDYAEEFDSVKSASLKQLKDFVSLRPLTTGW